jgi:GT2 family glycosyltransferase
MISIAIVSLNNPEYLDLTLQSIVQNTSGTYEILIHLNSCTSEDKQIVDKWQGKANIAICTTSIENEFCAAPLNRLFNRYAKGEYFIFLDDDIYVAPGWDKALIEAIPNQKYWWLSPTLYYPKYLHQPARFNIQSFGITPKTFNKTAFNQYYLDLRNITEDNKGWISGAGLISREVWNEIGGYDEQFKLGEDVDIKAKIWKAATTAGESYDFRSIADSIVYHFGHSGSSKRPVVINPFELFRQKWGMSITEFYKKALPEIQYL